jgi:hypothetical protein
MVFFTALGLGMYGCDTTGPNSDSNQPFDGGCNGGDDPTDTQTATDTDTNTATQTMTETATETETQTETTTETETDQDQGEVGPVSPVVNGTGGYATRYWDCCKPHCGWEDNVPEGILPVGTCNINNESNGDDYLVKSSCDGGDGFTCFNMAPYAKSDTLAYGYAAVSASGDICGKCYQLDFKGTSDSSPNDPGAAALAGKTMIVQATNIGYDVSNGQIDVLVPGGGVGAFDACTNQWGASADQMGKQYGGFLAACKEEVGWNASLNEYKSCVRQRCENLFTNVDGDLLAGCLWFVDWFEVADNPALVFQEVECPAELNDISGMMP